MSRLLIYAVLIWLGYFLTKKILRSLFAPPEGQSTEHAPPSTDAELIQDPQCGAYFLKQRGIKGVVGGKVIHFCSEECYDKYRKRFENRPTNSQGAST